MRIAFLTKDEVNLHLAEATGLLVVANLAPKVLRGQESQGMLLAAETGRAAVPVSVPNQQTGASVE
jgi:tRNA-binding EMAP/Myf-like protein